MIRQETDVFLKDAKGGEVKNNMFAAAYDGVRFWSTDEAAKIEFVANVQRDARAVGREAVVKFIDLPRVR